VGFPLLLEEKGQGMRWIVAEKYSNNN